MLVRGGSQTSHRWKEGCRQTRTKTGLRCTVLCCIRAGAIRMNPYTSWYLWMSKYGNNYEYVHINKLVYPLFPFPVLAERAESKDI